MPLVSCCVRVSGRYRDMFQIGLKRIRCCFSLFASMGSRTPSPDTMHTRVVHMPYRAILRMVCYWCKSTRGPLQTKLQKDVNCQKKIAKSPSSPQDISNGKHDFMRSLSHCPFSRQKWFSRPNDRKWKADFGAATIVFKDLLALFARLVRHQRARVCTDDYLKNQNRYHPGQDWPTQFNQYAEWTTLRFGAN